MKEIAATIHLHNNRLLERRKDMGWSQVELAQRIGIDQSKYSKLERMAMPARNSATKIWANVALQVAEFWGESPEELFPQAVIDVKKNTAHIKFDVGEVALQSDYTRQQRLLPDSTCADKQILERVYEAIDTQLDARERTIITFAFGLGVDDRLTDEDLADVLDCSSERVRQVRVEAIRKLRRGTKMGKNDALPGEQFIYNAYYRKGTQARSRAPVKQRKRGPSNG